MQKTITIAAALFISAGLANAQTIILDDFDANPNDDAGGPRQANFGVINNEFGLTNSFLLDTGIMINGDVGAILFSSDVGVTQVAQINWDNNDAGLNLDTTALGIVGFELDFVGVDQEFSFSFEAETFGGGSATIDFVVGAGDSTVAWTLGDLDIGAGFDATDVDGLTLVFNISPETEALDFALTEFRAQIPTPGSLALLGAGGLLALRRRR
ncbi:MAG: hypothetical protein AAF995_06745 [Planctomycetota bacterium]